MLRLCRVHPTPASCLKIQQRRRLRKAPTLLHLTLPPLPRFRAGSAKLARKKLRAPMPPLLRPASGPPVPIPRLPLGMTQPSEGSPAQHWPRGRRPLLPWPLRSVPQPPPPPPSCCCEGRAGHLANSLRPCVRRHPRRRRIEAAEGMRGLWWWAVPTAALRTRPRRRRGRAGLMAAEWQLRGCLVAAAV